MGCCFVESVAIKSQSLFVTHVANDKVSSERVTHQFKYIDASGWRLIGAEMKYENLETGERNAASINLLDGAVKAHFGGKGQPKKAVTLKVPKNEFFLEDYVFDHASGGSGFPRQMTGTIKGFECGDNCYLSVESEGEEFSALCEAEMCTPWFENASMPEKFIGKEVSGIVMTGEQRNSEGDLMGAMDAWKTLEFLD